MLFSIFPNAPKNKFRKFSHLLLTIEGIYGIIIESEVCPKMRRKFVPVSGKPRIYAVSAVADFKEAPVNESVVLRSKLLIDEVIF